MALVAVAAIIIVVVAAGAVYLIAQPAPKPTVKARVALILNGYKEWLGWYANAYSALMLMKDKYGIETALAEMVEYKDQERVLNELASEGYDLIWGHSGAFDYTMPPVAEKYPNTHFLITGGRFDQLPNVLSIDQAWRDTIFISGALAAMMSETNVVGYQIGEPYPTVLDEMNAFTIGAKYVKPNIKVLTSILGNWFDVEAAKEAALGMIAQGADVVSGWTGALPDSGIATAAKERGVYYIAADGETHKNFEDISLGATVYSFDLNLEEALINLTNDTWVGGNRLYGIASTKPAGQYIDHIFNEKLLPQTVLDSITKLRQDVIAAGGVGTMLPSENWWAPLAEYVPG